MQGAIFDLDGTLLDSMQVWNQVDVDFLAKRGIVMPDDYPSTIASMQFRDIATYTIERFHLSETEEDLMDEWSRMATYMYAHEVTLKPHAREYLASLHNRGVRLAIATTLTPHLRDPAMHHLAIAQYFDAVVSVDDAHHVGKTQPDVYLLAAQRIGVKPSECMVFEDLYEGILSAKSVGMQVCAMFDPSSKHRWEEIMRIADYTINDFKQAPQA